MCLISSGSAEKCFICARTSLDISMGMCLPCLSGAEDDVVVTPDPETRRRQLAEAAEKRQKETTYRGIKNPEALERKKKKQEEMEKETVNSTPAGGGGLKWQVG
ncbi:small VCP/p97-interacting protein-like isoform X2 [Xyrauchen texanus]|uniref:small VCP/p97-interacting protein-like isoform X2 n=1 Tax=Xyrauchen texanus TaxID=154827 RepID=UPI0022428C7E|nr:small VCP/p97-interacting protein-like isoform X2 [Xyrauchen texanus]